MGGLLGHGPCDGYCWLPSPDLVSVLQEVMQSLLSQPACQWMPPPPEGPGAQATGLPPQDPSLRQPLRLTSPGRPGLWACGASRSQPEGVRSWGARPRCCPGTRWGSGAMWSGPQGVVPRESAGALQGGAVAPLVFLHQHWVPPLPVPGAQVGSRGRPPWEQDDHAGPAVTGRGPRVGACGAGRALAVSVPQPCGCC